MITQDALIRIIYYIPLIYFVVLCFRDGEKAKIDPFGYISKATFWPIALLGHVINGKSFRSFWGECV